MGSKRLERKRKRQYYSRDGVITTKLNKKLVPKSGPALNIAKARIVKMMRKSEESAAIELAVHQCDVCNQSFGHKGALTVHKRTCKRTCKICKKQFKGFFALKAHEKTHKLPRIKPIAHSLRPRLDADGRREREVIRLDNHLEPATEKDSCFMPLVHGLNGVKRKDFLGIREVQIEHLDLDQHCAPAVAVH